MMHHPGWRLQQSGHELENGEMKRMFGGLLIAATILTPIAPAAAQAAGERVQIAQRGDRGDRRSEEHTSELQSLMLLSYAVFCLTKKRHTSSAHTISSAHKQT